MPRSSLWDDRLAFGEQVHDAEAAGIGVDDARAVIEVEHHMVVGPLPGLARRRLEIEFAEVARAPCREHGEAPRHAEVDEQEFARIEARQDVFGPPPQAGDPAGR